MENRTISNRYRILQQLSEGGFGQTFLAEDLHLPTKPRCVVKQLKPQFTDEESKNLASRLFEQEAEVLCRLGSHQYIPSLLAHFEEAGEFYLVQELIEGYTLAQEFAQGKRFSEKEAVESLLQILETLTFVHSQNVIHRDIKPSNLIRRYSDGKIFLIDFGAVKQVNVNQNGQNPTFYSTVAIGSEGYMPSEQIAGKPRFASDLYALGLVMIEGLTGIHPVKLSQNQNSGEFVWQHKTQLRPDIQNLITRMTRYDFRQRYLSATEAHAALSMIARSNIGFATQNVLPPQQNIAPPLQHIVPQQKIVVQQNIATQQPQQRIVVQQKDTVYKPLPPTATPVYPPQVEITTPVFQVQPQMPYPLPPTIVEPVKYKKSTQSKGALGWLWNNDLALGAFVTLTVLGLFVVGGYALVRGFSSASNQPSTQDLSQSKIPQFQSVNAYQEAETQAQEAAAKERRGATQKFEWDEIGNGYKRAYSLMASIDQANPDYPMAQQKMKEYKEKSESAFQKASGSADTATSSDKIASTNQPTFASTSTLYPTPVPSPAQQTITMPPKQSYKTYVSYTLLNHTGVETKTITTDDAIFTSRVEKRSENMRDSDVVRIRIEGGGYSSASLELKPVHGSRLTTGNYPDAQEYSWQSPTMPAVAFDKIHCFQNGHHSFTVNNIIYDAIPTTVAFLEATFTLNCGRNKLMGRIRYDAR